MLPAGDIDGDDDPSYSMMLKGRVTSIEIDWQKPVVLDPAEFYFSLFLKKV